MSRLDDDIEEGWFARNRAALIPGALLALLAGVIFYFLHDTAGIRREAPPLPTLIATLPPPPPPPPPKQQEVEKKVEEQQKPVETPRVNDAPRPMTINGPAQAGSDAFNVGAGNGGGMGAPGGGLGEADYSRYLGSAFQQAVQNDERVNRLVFSAEISVWVNDSGHVTRAEVTRSSGDPKLDQALVEVLESMPALDEAPPSSVEFPARIEIRGRRASG